MASIAVRTAPDAQDTDVAYIAAVTRELANEFAGVRCFAHKHEPQVVAIIQKDGQVEVEASVCCRQLAEAVDIVLSRYHPRR